MQLGYRHPWQHAHPMLLLFRDCLFRLEGGRQVRMAEIVRFLA